MDKTKVDDMLIQMIQPKLEEIETRFSNGEGLSSEDINTLLLKSQYNHINHLDEKLNEVTDSVASLKGEFAGLKGEFAGLKGEFSDLKGEFSDLKGDFTGLRGEFVGLKGEFKLLEQKVNKGFELMGARMDAFEKRIELKISEAINKNMRWSIGLIALIVTVLKLADTFAGN
ncbi:MULTISPECIES: hypothetical protein [unclassified Oleiphilus]|uniref:hypothetical protein n=3 Tax=Oleiphilus TaxID=141450 RepID=UPI0007C204D8|nr:MULTISPECIES: hypothetical protein [unclassified Oleiphilus]KZY30497.1 hypothetical protein A3729_10620 [Oleiphilus sp. HI0043]KZZ68316.1 hypothetical protein A3763_14495 [Oleiphilus sp. HI0128]